jgi:hypothetical protein
VVQATSDTVKVEAKEIKAQVQAVKHDTVTLTKAITRYKTLRDTAVIHDTVLVSRADTVVKDCQGTVASISSLSDVEAKENATEAHEIKALKAEHPPFAPHLGITLGPGVLVGVGTKPQYGLVGAVGVTFTPF